MRIGFIGAGRMGVPMIRRLVAAGHSVRAVGRTPAAPAAVGRHVVDAPVSGGPHDIAAGSLTVFLGGHAAGVERARPVLAACADPILEVGALGNGQRVKLVNNSLFAAQIGLVTAAVRLAGQLGLTEAEVLAALPHASSSGRAVHGIAAKGSVAAFAESVGDFLRKDVAVARELADRLGGDLGPLDPAIRAAVEPA